MERNVACEFPLSSVSVGEGLGAPLHSTPKSTYIYVSWNQIVEKKITKWTKVHSHRMKCVVEGKRMNDISKSKWSWIVLEVYFKEADITFISSAKKLPGTLRNSTSVISPAHWVENNVCNTGNWSKGFKFARQIL